MPLEERLVDGDGFHTNAFGLRIETNDSVDHQERETMRENLHDLIGIESAVTGWNWTRHCHRVSSRLFADDQAGQVRIDCVPRFDCDDVPSNPPSGQGEVTDDVQDFVAHKFIGKPQWLLA